MVIGARYVSGCVGSEGLVIVRVVDITFFFFLPPLDHDVVVGKVSFITLIYKSLRKS